MHPFLGALRVNTVNKEFSREFYFVNSVERHFVKNLQLGYDLFIHSLYYSRVISIYSNTIQCHFQ